METQIKIIKTLETFVYNNYTDIFFLLDNHKVTPSNKIIIQKGHSLNNQFMVNEERTTTIKQELKMIINNLNKRIQKIDSINSNNKQHKRLRNQSIRKINAINKYK